jgi:hypothetical protein
MSTQTNDTQYPLPENIGGLVDTCWSLLIIALWPDKDFQLAEEQAGRKIIRQYLVNQRNAYTAYGHLCRQILLHHQQHVCQAVSILPDGPLPWLKAAISDTMNVHEKASGVNDDQQPRLQKGLRVLPEALLEFTEEPCAGIFHYWVRWFREKHAGSACRLFEQFTAYHQFKLPQS